ncbi:hypothetical protein K491DRAFT_685193 [Lophiostoma macrostomum CBS 122681]|uniref:Uncharacterized protein n=1 Tax=Lophiostoma macrostomum CBS 122681 TaxID=1314788 RepID=A0A6A6SLJ3_9PLEO|nr:hypothetical protein K491DRAFT_685193 [Lophiostoma macrostomum CBS 122681]
MAPQQPSTTSFHTASDLNDGLNAATILLSLNPSNPASAPAALSEARETTRQQWLERQEREGTLSPVPPPSPAPAASAPAAGSAPTASEQSPSDSKSSRTLSPPPDTCQPRKRARRDSDSDDDNDDCPSQGGSVSTPAPVPAPPSIIARAADLDFDLTEETEEERCRFAAAAAGKDRGRARVGFQAEDKGRAKDKGRARDKGRTLLIQPPTDASAEKDNLQTLHKTEPIRRRSQDHSALQRVASGTTTPFTSTSTSSTSSTHPHPQSRISYTTLTIPSTTRSRDPSIILHFRGLRQPEPEPQAPPSQHLDRIRYSSRTIPHPDGSGEPRIVMRWRGLRSRGAVKDERVGGVGGQYLINSTHNRGNHLHWSEKPWTVDPEIQTYQRYSKQMIYPIPQKPSSDDGRQPYTMPFVNAIGH